MNTCPNCGTEVSTPFCPQCGAQVPQGPDSGVPAESPGAQSSATEQAGAQAPNGSLAEAETSTPQPYESADNIKQPTGEVNTISYGTEASNTATQGGGVASSAPPFSGPTSKQKASKPFYKRKGVIIAAAIVILLALIGSCSGSQNNQDNSGPTQSAEQNSSEQNAATTEEGQPTVKSIKAEYNGSTEAGVKLDEDNYNIEVTATYSDGSKDSVSDWTIDKPATLKAGKKSTVLIEYEGKETKLTVECTSLTAKEYKEACESYSYKDLAKHPTKYEGKMIKLTGKVIQVLDDGTGTINLRINVTKGSYGIWDDTVFVVYEYSGDDEERVLEDDIVTVWGMFAGQYSYESTLGATITVPSMQAEYLSVSD